ncbi:MAG TPA: DsrE family protein [Pyrinomonadaceae bacterium]|nr:DsrE family protein [Pyrinomonadaceae bacterium]
MLAKLIFVGAVLFGSGTFVHAQKWPDAKAPLIASADGYVDIPEAAFRPSSRSTYKGIFDATRFSTKPEALIPAVNAVGGLLNDLAVGGTPKANRQFVIVFHGPATDGILDNEHYKEKFGVDNPNLAVLSKMRDLGIELYVCGQHLAGNNIDPKTLSKDVIVASDAYLVLIGYQNKGYATMWF